MNSIQARPDKAARPRTVPRDIDDIAVERACSGDRNVNLNPAEMAVAFHALTQRGYSARVIGERLGVTSRTVCRWRSGRNSPYTRFAYGRGPS